MENDAVQFIDRVTKKTLPEAIHTLRDMLTRLISQTRAEPPQVGFASPFWATPANTTMSTIGTAFLDNSDITIIVDVKPVHGVFTVSGYFVTCDDPAFKHRVKYGN
jgi:hypothetical protein